LIVFKKLTKTEAADRSAAIVSAKKFINNVPQSGVDQLPVPKLWGNKDTSAKRIDIEVTTGKAFSDILLVIIFNFKDDFGTICTT
jgi:hypothetical protein